MTQERETANRCVEEKASEEVSPWWSAEAWRTYIAGALWAGGTMLAFVVERLDVAGWLKLRLDTPGLLLLAAALIGGWNFLPKGFRAAVSLRLDMNFLMTIAILGALLVGEPIEAAAIAFLFSLAELLEDASVARSRRSVEELIRLSPERANLVQQDGGEKRVLTSELRTGQRVRVRPGEKIPIDGQVVGGQAAVDQATVTGESVPVAKEQGDPVYAGTVCHEGTLEIEATTDAGNTTLDRIMKLLREAQGRRTKIEHFVQRFARVYTPIVAGLAVVVITVPPALGWGSNLVWFIRGLTLLVVACPCALVIATPVTVVSGLTAAARHGVLVKGGEYLEGLGEICTMAFDKTGTLTEGRMQVTDIEPLDGGKAIEVLALAAAVEAFSEHPIARAIVERSSRESARVPSSEGFRAVPGRGVFARVDGREVGVGTQELFAGIEPPKRIAELERSGKTVVLVMRDEQLIGLIGLADRVRAGVRPVLQRLREMGIHEQVMLTGDHEAVARSVADQVGIQDVRARLLPEQKVGTVRQLRERHRGVAMVGDGVNDAPALAAATIGVAMGAAGSPATIETADLALMADDLEMLPYAVALAKKTRRVIRFNIAFSIGVKAVLGVGAVLGVVSLLVAVLVGDMGASLFVTLNASRLSRFSS